MISVRRLGECRLPGEGGCKGREVGVGREIGYVKENSVFRVGGASQ